MGRTLPAPVPCKVCGDRSYGKHYGVYCCDGCSCFFKRSVRRSIIYTCISGDSRCVIDKARRNWCPYCRLQRCFAVRMNTSAVQEERGPRKPKIKSHESKISKTNRDPQSQIITHSYTSPNLLYKPQVNSQHDLAAQILLVAVKRARSNSGFGLLNRKAQDEILTYLWGPLFILKAAYWPGPSLSTFMNSQNTFKIIRDLKMDYFELEVMENMLLCRGDLIGDSKQSVLADNVKERSLQALGNRTVSDPRRILKLLLTMSLLFTPSPGALCALLFRAIIGTIPMETIILTI